MEIISMQEYDLISMQEYGNQNQGYKMQFPCK
jgi:hypothetical protein